MKYFEMFAGIGGFRYGIEKAYTHLQKPFCIGFSEIDKYAIQIYKKHYSETKNYGDATRIIPEELPNFDLLVGGFPCQSFSIAGKRGGFKDTRGTLFFDIARIARIKRPELLLLENVKGLLSHDKGRTFGTILSTLSGMGYFLEWQILNSTNFGIPQIRERVFIVGHLRREYNRKIFPIRKGIATTNNSKSRRFWYSTLCSYWGVRGKGRIPAILRNGKWTIPTEKECERLQGFPDNWTEGISDMQRYKCLGNAVTTTVITEIIKRLFLA